MAQNNTSLSKRLQMIAKLCPKAETIGDIGCDHAYLSIYLVTAGIADKVIAADINPLPLERAGKNILSKGLSDVIEIRRSDGLSAFRENELDCAVFAGMGGRLMADIVEKSIAQKVLPPVFICQPQSEIPFFRRFLYESGCMIDDEDMIEEDQKYYWAMRVIFNKEVKKSALSEIELNYGSILIQRKHRVFSAYLEKELQRVKNILITLDIKSERAQKAKHALEVEFDFISSAIKLMR